LSPGENTDTGTYRMIKYNCITIGRLRVYYVRARARTRVYAIDENHTRVDVFHDLFE